jgi:hypothetical protein
MSESPNSLEIDEAGLMGEGIEEVDDCEDGDEGVEGVDDVVDSESDPEAWLEDLLSVRVRLKNDLAGEAATGVIAPNGMPGMLTSLRTTIKEICSRFRASLCET